MRMTLIGNSDNNFVCILKKATASAADLWETMLGCLDAWMLGCLPLCLPGGRFGTNLNYILEAFDHLWCLLQGSGVIRAGVARVPKLAIWYSCEGGITDLG